MTDGPNIDPDRVGARSPRSSVLHRRPAVLGVIFIGGALGTWTRAVLADAVPTRAGGVPWTTLGINVAGALLLGLLLEALTRTGPDAGWRRSVRLGVGTGLLGGFTTYSTFAVETVERLTPGSLFVGLAYPLISVVLGVIAAAVGHRIAHRLRRRGRGAEENA